VARKFVLRYALQDAFGYYFLCDRCQRAYHVCGALAAKFASKWLPDGWTLRKTAGKGLAVLCPVCAERHIKGEE
jgi:hypothetical protein